MTDEMAIIKKDVDEFLLKNQENFEMMKKLQDQVVNLTKENFRDTIQLIEDHKTIFFKDHGATFTFMHYIVRAALFNFKKLELVLDLCVHFRGEIRSKITDNEILTTLSAYQISISYLFSKDFFSIDTIYQKALTNDEMFINFLPEIEEYDPEYTKVRLKSFLANNQNHHLKKIYEDVQADPKKHILNRTACYHPSLLHKSIREDDIETFQSLLYKNNYSFKYVIEFSIYERAQTIDHDLSLIKVAATYGSIQIFKFLWMQKEIDPPSNILLYAFFGCNNEIIHLCEDNYPDKKAILQTIYLNRLDFLDYYIDNFSYQLEENNEDVKTILSNYKSNNEKDDLYEELNSEQLHDAIDFYTVPVIQSALCKICFIIRNIELNNDLFQSLNKELLVASLIHFDLFKFLFTQRNENINAVDGEIYFYCIGKAVIYNAIDSFLFLMDELKGFINYFAVFEKSIYYSRTMITNYLLDLQIKEKESVSENTPIYDSINNQININLFMIQVDNYNEEIIVKMLKLYNLLLNKEDIELFVYNLTSYASSKMIKNLLKKILPEFDDVKLNNFAAAFENYDSDVANFIKEYIKIREGND